LSPVLGCGMHRREFLVGVGAVGIPGYSRDVTAMGGATELTRSLESRGLRVDGVDEGVVRVSYVNTHGRDSQEFVNDAAFVVGAYADAVGEGGGAPALEATVRDESGRERASWTVDADGGAGADEMLDEALD